MKKPKNHLNKYNDLPRAQLQRAKNNLEWELDYFTSNINSIRILSPEAIEVRQNQLKRIKALLLITEE